MKLLYIKDQNENYAIPEVPDLSIEVLLFDIKGQWSNLQQLVEHVAEREFDGIVVSARLGSEADYWGLDFCMRLRLSYSTIKTKAFKTLFVFTENPVEEIIKEQIEKTKTQPTGTLLLTIGTFIFNSIDSFDIVALPVKNYNLLNEENFKSLFLNVVIVNRQKMGSHSLANLLGALRFAEVTGHRDVIESNTEIVKTKSDLFVKYKTDYRKKGDTKFTRKHINSKGKNILLIDDKEHFGWGDILKSLFQDAVFDFVEAGENFLERANKKLFNTPNDVSKWDLILLDLRLKDEEDTDDWINKRADEYSGAQLLQKIKDNNQGVQVIVFTASNKAWNFKQLTDLGADGYFVKESPEVDLSDEYTLKNYESFVEQVKVCYEYNFLKDFYRFYQEIEIIFKQRVTTKTLPKEFVNEYLKWLRLGNSNISKNRDELGLTTSFLLYFSVLENISNRIIDVDNPIAGKPRSDGKMFFQFEFRTRSKKLLYFKETPKDSGIYLKTLSTDFSRNITWSQKVLNTFDFLSNQKIDMSIVNRLLKKRHDIIHANPTTGGKIAVEKNDIIELYRLITDNISKVV